MKQFLRLTVIAVLAATLPTALLADDAVDPAARAAEMQSELGLTNAQTKQIQDILTDSKGQAQAVKANKSLSDDQQEAQLKKIRQDTKSKVGGVLTMQQKLKYKEMQKD